MRPRWAVLIALAGGLLGPPAAESAPLVFGPALRVDHATLPDREWALASLSCPSSRLCVAVGASGQVQTSDDPAKPGSWRSRVISPRAALQAVSCPSASLCVALTVTGRMLTATDPRSGPWKRTPEIIGDTGVTGGISCPSVSLCVAADGGSEIAVSTDPAHGKWQATEFSGFYQLNAVSCPTVSLCAIADFGGSVITSTDPAGGPATWRVRDVGAADPDALSMDSISCGSVSECLIGTQDGDVVESADPTGGALDWTTRRLDLTGSMVVSCLGGGQCVSADDRGNVFRSADPVAGRPWTVTYDVDPSGMYTLDCPTVTLCVSSDGDDSPMSSADLGEKWAIGPATGGGARLAPALVGLSCPRVSLCVAIDAAGRALVSTDVSTDVAGGRGAGRWAARTINPGINPSGVSCTARGFCAVVGPESTVSSVSDVLGGSARWRTGDLSRYPPGRAHDPLDESLGGVSCVSSRFCVATRFDAAGGNANVEVSHDPGGPLTSWHAARFGRGRSNFTAVSCPAVRLCVAANADGPSVAVSTDGGVRWRLVHLAGSGGSVLGVSCPSRSFCAAVSDSGRVYTTVRPAAGAAAWHGAVVDPGQALYGVACASRTLCATYDGRGLVLVSSDPAGGRSAGGGNAGGGNAGSGNAGWSSHATHQNLTAVACPAARLCLLTTSRGAVIVGRARR